MFIISHNNKCADLLREYDLPEDLSFHIDIPAKVQEILEDGISVTELGVTLSVISKGLCKATASWDNQSYIEDNKNHFHVDWYAEPGNSKKAFMLGIKTLLLLAQKFEKEKFEGIRFWYYFQTPELGRQWAKAHNLHDDADDEYFISDRLSFYTRREGEFVVDAKIDSDPYGAVLTIDI